MFNMVKRKKRVVKKRAPVKAKTKSRVKSKAPAKPQGKVFSKSKLLLVSRNLVFFIILFVISYILYLVSEEGGVFSNIFYLLAIIFVFISLAFLISLLLLLLLKWIKR